MGFQVASEAARQLPLVRDPAITRFVSELGRLLVHNADTTGREYTFYVVNSPAANAFAVPGGFIFINRGILELADNVAELAGVLAHEIGHVVARHSLEQMTKAQNANAVVTLVYLLLNRTPGVGEQVALQVAGGAWLAKHSREAEREADRVGVVFMARARIDPHGMPSFFEEMLEQERRRSDMVLQWFSSHPLTHDRIADTRALIAQLPPEALARTRLDVPQFANLKARVAALPPPPPDPTASSKVP